MTRAERSRSKLFESDGLFGGTTKNLIYESGHNTGGKTLAGKFVTPTEEEGKFRYEIGDADYRGVDFIGSASASGTGVRGVTITPHASTQTGDLMVLSLIQGSSLVGDDVTPGLGWNRVTNYGAQIEFAGGYGGVFFKRAEANDPASFFVRLASESDTSRAISAHILTFRNARMMTTEDINILEDNGTTETTFTHDTGQLVGVPKGSYVVAVAAFGDTSTNTVTPPSGFTETYDNDETDTGGYYGLEVAYKQVLEGGAVDVGDCTISSAPQRWATKAFVIEPKQLGIIGWTGEPGSETFEINEHGKARFSEFVGDLRVHGDLRYQKPFVLVCKASDQNYTSGSNTDITFTGPLYNDLNIFDDANDAFSFDGELHRGLWKIQLVVRWEANNTNRRLAEIKQDGVAVQSHNTGSPNSGNAYNIVIFYLSVTSDTMIQFAALQNSGSTIAVQGNNTQDQTFICAEYLRDID